MGVVAGGIAPHPPIIVDEVGGASTSRVASTIEAMHRLADRLAAQPADTLVIMSPHSPQMAEAQPVRTGPELEGSLAAFNAPDVTFEFKTDVRLAESILSAAGERGLPMEALGPRSTALGLSMYGEQLDHGVTVPLYFLRDTLALPIVNLGMAFLSYDTHYRIGSCIAQAADATGRRVIFVASGDMSHRLVPGAPAGYSPQGERLDAAICERLRNQDFEGLRRLDPELVEMGGECGLRSIITLTGCFAEVSAVCDVMSYEGPFGVGYLVAYMAPNTNRETQ